MSQPAKHRKSILDGLGPNARRLHDASEARLRAFARLPEQRRQIVDAVAYIACGLNVMGAFKKRLEDALEATQGERSV
jgi:hypothetical protein